MVERSRLWRGDVHRNGIRRSFGGRSSVADASAAIVLRDCARLRLVQLDCLVVMLWWKLLQEGRFRWRPRRSRFRISATCGSFADSEALALRGMRRVGFTCYVVTAAQVLLRTPGVREWLHEHAAVCAGQCAVCSLADTSGQMVSGFGPVRNRVQPFFAVQRARVGAYFGDARQHDVVGFVEAFLARARDCDRAAGRYDTWGHVQLSDSPVATHADRLFTSVTPERGWVPPALER